MCYLSEDFDRLFLSPEFPCFLVFWEKILGIICGNDGEKVDCFSIHGAVHPSMPGLDHFQKSKKNTENSTSTNILNI